MLGPIVPLMQFHLRQMAPLSVIPFEWREGSPYPSLVKPQRKLQDYRVNLTISLGYGVVMTGNYLRNLDELTMTQRMLAIVYIFMTLCIVMYRLNSVWKGHRKLVQLFESFLKFEGENRPVPIGNGHLLTKLVALFGTVTVPNLVVLESALLLVRPCMAPALEYILLGGAGTCCKLALWWRIPIILCDAYIWLTNVSVGCFYAFQACFGLMRGLDTYLRNVRQMLEGNSAEEYRQGIRQYQQIQLLALGFNDAFQAVFLPSIMFGLWIFFVVSMYACVKLHDLIDMPEFALFPLMLVNSLVAAFVVKVAANVIDQSEKCLEMARNNQGFGRKLLFKRMIRSLGKIRVRFGSTNFVDQLTPFNLLNLGLDTCVNLMLLS